MTNTIKIWFTTVLLYFLSDIEVEDPREWVGVQMTLKRRNSKVHKLPLATDTRSWLDIGVAVLWRFDKIMDAVMEQHMKNCNVCKSFFSKEHLMFFLMNNRQDSVQGMFGNPHMNGSTRIIPPPTRQESVSMTASVPYNSTKTNPVSYFVKKVIAEDGSMSYVVNLLPSVQSLEEEEQSIINTIQAVENSSLDTSVNSNFVPNSNISPVKKVVDIHPSVYMETNNLQKTGSMSCQTCQTSVNTEKSKVMTSDLSHIGVNTEKSKVMTSDLSHIGVNTHNTKVMNSTPLPECVITEKVKVMTPTLCPATGMLLHETNANTCQSSTADDNAQYSSDNDSEQEMEMMNSEEDMNYSPSMEVSQETEVMTSAPYPYTAHDNKVVTSSPYKASNVSQNSEVIASLLPLVVSSSGKELVDNSSLIEVKPLTSVSSTQPINSSSKIDIAAFFSEATEQLSKAVHGHLKPREISMQAVHSISKLELSPEKKQELLQDAHHINAVVRHVADLLQMTTVRGKVMQEASIWIKHFIPNIDMEDKQIKFAMKRRIVRHIFYSKKRYKTCSKKGYIDDPEEKKCRKESIVPSKRMAEDGTDEELLKERNEICLLYEGYPVGKAKVQNFPYNFHKNIKVEDKMEWVGVQLTLKKRRSKVPCMPLATDTRIWEKDVGKGTKFAWRISDVKKVEFYDLYIKEVDQKKRYKRQKNKVKRDTMTDEGNLSDSQYYVVEENDMEEDS